MIILRERGVNRIMSSQGPSLRNGKRNHVQTHSSSSCEFSFPQLIVVPLSCHEVDGVRKEKERLTAAQDLLEDYERLSVITVPHGRYFYYTFIL